MWTRRSFNLHRARPVEGRCAGTYKCSVAASNSITVEKTSAVSKCGGDELRLVGMEGNIGLSPGHFCTGVLWEGWPQCHPSASPATPCSRETHFWAGSPGPRASTADSAARGIGRHCIPTLLVKWLISFHPNSSINQE